jgi:hypothetical protein
MNFKRFSFQLNYLIKLSKILYNKKIFFLKFERFLITEFIQVTLILNCLELRTEI